MSSIDFLISIVPSGVVRRGRAVRRRSRMTNTQFRRAAPLLLTGGLLGGILGGGSALLGKVVQFLGFSAGRRLCRLGSLVGLVHRGMQRFAALREFLDLGVEGCRVLFRRFSRHAWSP